MKQGGLFQPLRFLPTQNLRTNKKYRQKVKIHCTEINFGKVLAVHNQPGRDYYYSSDRLQLTFNYSSAGEDNLFTMQILVPANRQTHKHKSSTTQGHDEREKTSCEFWFFKSYQNWLQLSFTSVMLDLFPEICSQPSKYLFWCPAFDFVKSLLKPVDLVTLPANVLIGLFESFDLDILDVLQQDDNHIFQQCFP